MNNKTEDTKTTIALVTGGSKGIGQACVIALTKLGYHVAFSYASDTQGAEQTIKLASEFGETPLAIKSDVSLSKSVDEMFSEIEDKIGNVTVLVNNAGIAKDNLVMRMKDDEWNAVIDTNLSGAFYAIRRASRNMMKNKWGRIINISSINAYVGPPGQINYAAAKAGLIGMTRSVASELASRNITANVIAPGAIDTPIWSETAQERIEQITTSIPLARFGQPEEIASAVAFLASKESSYITGVVLPVDGGVGMGT